MTGQLVIISVLCLLGIAIAAPPAAWISKIQDGTLLYTDDDSLITSDQSASVGNGFLATTIGSSNIYAAGLYTHTNNKTFLAAVPSPVATSLLSASRTNKDVNHTSTSYSLKAAGAGLDLTLGVYTRRIMLVNNGTDEILVELKWYAHRTLQSIIVTEVDAYIVTTNASISADSFTLNFKIPTLNFDHCANSSTSGYSVCANTVVGEFNQTTYVGIAYSSQSITLTWTVSGQTKFRDSFATAIRVSNDRKEAMRLAENDFKYVKVQFGLTDTALRIEHEKAFSNLFTSNIVIGNRPDVTALFYSALYYLYSSIPDPDTALASTYLSPNGLFNNENLGEVSTLAETAILPALVLLQPNVTASILQYRFDRAIAARAADCGYNPLTDIPLQFPSQSADSGVNPSLSNTFDLFTTGGVSLGASYYYSVSNDADWLAKVGYPLIKGAADAFKCYATVNGQSVHYLGVSTPDASVTKKVDDSIYTNALASIALHTANYWGRHYDDPLSTVSLWGSIASGVAVPTGNGTDHLVPYVGYNGRMVSSADVASLAFPLNFQPFTTDSDLVARELKYYLNRTDIARTPSHVWSSYVVGLLGAGGDINQKNATDIFEQTMEYANGPFNVWPQNGLGAGTNYLPGLASYINSVIYGFFGARLQNGALSFTFTPLLNSTSSSLNFQYMFAKFSVTYYHGQNIIVRQNTPAPNTTFAIGCNGALSDLDGGFYCLNTNTVYIVPKPMVEPGVTEKSVLVPAILLGVLVLLCGVMIMYFRAKVTAHSKGGLNENSHNMNEPLMMSSSSS